MEEIGDAPPFWAPPAAVRRRRSSPSPPLFSLPILIIILPLFVLILLLYVLPPFLSLQSNRTLKLSWDSFSIFLVFFAILSGIFANRNDDVSAVAPPPVSRPCFGKYNSDRKINTGDSPIRAAPATGVSGGLTRRCSSNVDLRQRSRWEAPECEDQFRCSDDFEINKYRSPAAPDYGNLRRTRTEIWEHADDAKVIFVDTCVLRSSSPSVLPPESPATPSRPQPEPTVLQREKACYESVRTSEKPGTVSQYDPEIGNFDSPARKPPPPAVAQRVHESEQKQNQGKLERRKSLAKKEIATVLASLYNQRKRSKKQQHAQNIRENASDSPTQSTHFSTTLPPPSPVPPPPPLPPPPSFLNSLFKKGLSKRKKIHSLPPPPAPLSSTPRTRTQIPPAPPKPSRRRHSSTSVRPPLIPVPPSRAADVKSVGSGDFARMKTSQSSYCISPKSEGVDQSSSASDGRDAVGSVFCASPDVNVKADTFIARLKDGWRLEKMNSLREKKDVGLGPQTGPGPR